ncbi:hypothetical protein BAME_23890 [Bacillus sp. M 2-6]|nr:hypothetical protein BAME_23890 [Bacillus sp. M 2-6]
MKNLTFRSCSLYLHVHKRVLKKASAAPGAFLYAINDSECTS